MYQQKEDQLAIFRRRQVGLIYQFYNLIPILNVVENMTLPVLMDGREVNQEFLTELVATLGLEGKEKKLPNELSGGQQQRVAIARALIKNPKLLLCDELTGALDTKSSRSVLTFIEKINKQFGSTIVIITHYTSIADMADYVVSIKDGKIDQLKENKEKIPASQLAL